LEARGAFQRAAELFEKSGAFMEQSRALASMAKTARDPRETILMMESSTAALRKVSGNEARIHEGEVRNSIAVMQGNYLRDGKAAEMAYTSAIQLFSQAGDHKRAAKSLRLLAGISAQIGDPSKVCGTMSSGNALIILSVSITLTLILTLTLIGGRLPFGGGGGTL